MAFPASPTVGQVYGVWSWNGVGWQRIVSAGGASLAWYEVVIVDTLASLDYEIPFVEIDYV